MSDMGDMFRDMKKERQERHAKWYQANTEVIRESGLSYTERETAFLFRPNGLPMVDFYPHTGRWKVTTNKPNGMTKIRMLHGGAKSFISWYKKFLESTKQ